MITYRCFHGLALSLLFYRQCLESVIALFIVSLFMVVHCFQARVLVICCVMVIMTSLIF